MSNSQVIRVYREGKSAQIQSDDLALWQAQGWNTKTPNELSPETRRQLESMGQISKDAPVAISEPAPPETDPDTFRDPVLDAAIEPVEPEGLADAEPELSEEAAEESPKSNKGNGRKNR